MCRHSLRQFVPVLLLVLLTALILGLAGCATFKEETHAKYEVGTPAKLREVPTGGIYQVQWMADENSQRHAVRASERILSAGDVFGFGLNPDGRVEAVAADEHFTLDQLPPNAHYCVWTISVLDKPSLIDQHIQRRQEIIRHLMGIPEPMRRVAVDVAIQVGVLALIDVAFNLGHVHGSHPIVTHMK